MPGGAVNGGVTIAVPVPCLGICCVKLGLSRGSIVCYTSPHPKDMRTETSAAMAETPEVCEHLHFPLQSGSDAVLAAMHRGYTGERYLEKLAEARSIIPDLWVSTDIIVGFPGETGR